MNQPDTEEKHRRVMALFRMRTEKQRAIKTLKEEIQEIEARIVELDPPSAN